MSHKIIQLAKNERKMRMKKDPDDIEMTEEEAIALVTKLDAAYQVRKKREDRLISMIYAEVEALMRSQFEDRNTDEYVSCFFADALMYAQRVEIHQSYEDGEPFCLDYLVEDRMSDISWNAIAYDNQLRGVEPRIRGQEDLSPKERKKQRKRERKARKQMKKQAIVQAEYDAKRLAQYRAHQAKLKAG